MKIYLHDVLFKEADQNPIVFKLLYFYLIKQGNSWTRLYLGKVGLLLTQTHMLQDTVYVAVAIFGHVQINAKFPHPRGPLVRETSNKQRDELFNETHKKNYGKCLKQIKG